jgi:predicted phage tail protein
VNRRNPPLHSIRLHGYLAEKFGDCFKLAVSTPREAIRALDMQVDGFGDAIRQGCFRLVRGKNPDAGMHYEVPYDPATGRFDVTMLYFSLGPDGEELHVVPAIMGAGGGGGGKIIIGAIMMIVAVVASVFTFGTAGVALAGASSAALSGASAGAVFAAVAINTVFWTGVSMVFSGVSMLLAPSVKPNYSMGESADSRASFFLGGQVNQSGQGIPVILGYGRCRIGSAVISAGLSLERI